ncbi:hypothetical protein [Clostridioides difficile]|uniref:hypothetical protein n=1 Tax=Clostridioides difficile TaxID=1496 RepID=UPI000D1EA550|nr:hypothetical protein [Clostridioides difficile]HBE9444562.1 hypothetical protein [Clostridioides difficile]
MAYIRITKDLLRILVNNNYKLWYDRISSDMRKLKQKDDISFTLNKTQMEDIATQIYLKSIKDDNFIVSSVGLSSIFCEYMHDKEIQSKESTSMTNSNFSEYGVKVSKVILKLLLFNSFNEYIKSNSIKHIKKRNKINLKLALDEILYKNQLEKDFILNKTLVLNIFEKHINSTN